MIYAKRFIRCILSSINYYAGERFLWFYDNSGTIQAVSKAGFRGCTEYVNTRRKGTREYVEREVLELKQVSTKGQMADINKKLLYNGNKVC